MGAERKSHYVDPKEKRMTAYHEVNLCDIEPLEELSINTSPVGRTRACCLAYGGRDASAQSHMCAKGTCFGYGMAFMSCLPFEIGL